MGHKIRSKKKTTIVLHFENEPKEINTLEEIEIMKVTSSNHMLKIIYCFFYYNILKSFIDVFVFVKDLIIKIINYQAE